MKVWVSGSIARDLIMDFPGRFRDFIDPKKIHVLNLSFAVENLKENIGGTAANICYNLSLLDERPAMIGNLGQDQVKLLNYFRKLGLDTKNIGLSRFRETATAYIITDKDDNQITGFHAGAMNEIRKKLPKVNQGDWAIVAPEYRQNMINLVKYYQKRKVNYIFDPGQSLTQLRKSELGMAIRLAKVLIGNDYEIGLMASSWRGVKRRSNPKGNEMALPPLADRNDLVVVRTRGPKGSEIFASGHKTKIGTAKPRRVLDPTGAGDAYRAGFLKGLILGYDLESCGQLGATVASFAVEEYGTQRHKFRKKEFLARLRGNFSNQLSF